MQFAKTDYRKCIYLKIKQYNNTPIFIPQHRIVSDFCFVIFFYNIRHYFYNFTTIPITPLAFAIDINATLWYNIHTGGRSHKNITHDRQITLLFFEVTKMSISRDAQRLLRQKAWHEKNGNEHSRLMAQYIFMQMQLHTERPPQRGSYTFYRYDNPMTQAIRKHLGFTEAK